MMNRGLLAGVYSICVALGFATLLFPAPSIEGAIGMPFTYFYGVLILAGAIGALVGVVLPNYRTEMYALWVMCAGFVSYDIALWSLFAERLDDSNSLPPPYGPALGIAALSLFLLTKAVFLYRRNAELIKAASNERLG